MDRDGLRDDEWDRIKDFLPGREGMSAARRRTIGFSSTRFSIAIGRAFPGRFGGPFWFVEKHAPKRYGSTSGCPLNLHGLRRTDTLRTLAACRT